mgnify:CR=1 FL=1
MIGLEIEMKDETTERILKISKTILILKKERNLLQEIISTFTVAVNRDKITKEMPSLLTIADRWIKYFETLEKEFEND